MQVATVLQNANPMDRKTETISALHMLHSNVYMVYIQHLSRFYQKPQNAVGQMVSKDLLNGRLHFRMVQADNIDSRIYTVIPE